MSTATSTLTQIVHPAWCDTASCVVNTANGQVDSVWHHSATRTHDVSAMTATVMLARADGNDADKATGAYVQIDGDGDCGVDDIESLGQWLIAQAAIMRQTIVTEAVPTPRGER